MIIITPRGAIIQSRRQHTYNRCICLETVFTLSNQLLHVYALSLREALSWSCGTTRGSHASDPRLIWGGISLVGWLGFYMNVRRSKTLSMQ